jgi:hypothetical protein
MQIFAYALHSLYAKNHKFDHIIHKPVRYLASSVYEGQQECE